MRGERACVRVDRMAETDAFERPRGTRSREGAFDTNLQREGSRDRPSKRASERANEQRAHKCPHKMCVCCVVMWWCRCVTRTNRVCVCVRGKLVVTRRTGIGARSQERRPYGHSVGYELNGRWPTVDGRQIAVRNKHRKRVKRARSRAHTRGTAGTRSERASFAESTALSVGKFVDDRLCVDVWMWCGGVECV